MKIFQLIFDDADVAWELRSRTILMQGDVIDGWFRITRVVHREGPTPCTKDTCEARDITGRAHLGACEVS